jgi:RNA polymerase-binding transcription factor DksA
MISKEILASNKRYLELEVERLEKALENHLNAGIMTEADKEFERGDVYNFKQIERENSKATRAKLEDCKIALKKMADGTYGICVDCGEEINEDRLRARPEASRCKPCQEKKGLRVR